VVGATDWCELLFTTIPAVVAPAASPIIEDIAMTMFFLVQRDFFGSVSFSIDDVL
jgi:hypothetical protein